MKRILYSCLFLVSLCLTNSVTAQGSYSISSNPICYSPTNSYTAQAGIVAHIPGAVNYTWSVISASPGCNITFTPVLGTAITNSLINISIPCCGLYTVSVTGLSGGGIPISTIFTCNPLFSGGYTTGVVFCPGAGITVPSQTICIGSTASLVANSANTYNWISQNVTGTLSIPNVTTLVTSPTVNTNYTVVGTTTAGCAVTGTTSITVQSATVGLSPASQSMCAGSPVSFTASAAVQTNTNVSPGTTITNYSWLDPGAVQFANGPGVTTATVLASAGLHSVVVTHTGAAGTCTVEAQANVVITTSVPVNITPASPSVCPNGTIALTAVSIQTTALTNHTWTSGTNGVLAFNGKILTQTIVAPPETFTVDVNYFGCPGQATVTVGLLALTPTLTSSSGLSSCPNGSITLTATGGSLYTFDAFPATGGSVSPLPKPTSSTAIYAPTQAEFPILFCVNSSNAGCTGTTCITVTERTLAPVLSPSSLSICPSTEFTLTSTTNGPSTAAGTTYTFLSPFNPLISTSSPTVNQAIYTPSNTTFPQTYTVLVDSAGCKGTGLTTINLLTLTPTLTASSPSICAGKQLTLTTSGAAINYTFYASEPQFTVSPTSTVILAGTSNVVTHTPSPTSTLVTYTVAVDSAGCVGSSTYSIGILDLGPTLAFGPVSPLSNSLCPGSSMTFSANGATSYTFVAPGNVTFGTPTSPNNLAVVNATHSAIPSVIPPGGVTYTLLSDSSGCVGTKTIVMLEHVLAPTISLSPTLICAGKTITLTTSGVGSGTNVIFSFVGLVPPTTTTSILSSPSFSTTDNPTTVTIYSTLVDSAGCKGVTPPATISLLPDLALIPSVSAASVCPGLNATLSVAGPTAITGITYTWTQISGSTSSLAPINSNTSIANPIAPSTYSVNAIDPLGCVGSTVITVGVDANISFPLQLTSSGSTICAGQSVDLAATTTIVPNGTIGNVTYTWTPNIGINTSIGGSVTASPTISTIYTVTADNSYGCVAQNTIAVPVGQYPNPANGFTISPTSPGVCVGFTSTLTAFGANSYTWTGSTFTVPIAQQSISVPFGTYTVVGSNGGGCTTAISIQIQSLTPLVLNITQSSFTTCIESNTPKFSKPVHLTASGAGTYVWFPYNPAYMTFSLGPQTDVRPPATTIYTVVGSNAICAGSQTVLVTVIPQFSMNVVPPLPAMCLGDSLKLSIVNIGTLAVGPVSALTYSWTEALNAPPISVSSYFTPTVMVYPQNTTTYSVEVRDSRQCISLPRLVTVTVLPRPLTSIAIPTINNVPTNTVCFVGLNPGPQDVTINLTGNNTNTGLAFGVVPTYTWVSPYGALYNSILTPANNNAITVNAPIRELNGSSVVVYTLISGYNGVQGCKRMDTVSIRVVDCRPVRNVKFTTAEPNDTICARNCVTYINQTDTMAGGPQKLFWTFRGGSPATSTANVPTVCYNVPGKYDVILKVENPYPLADGGSALSMGTLGYIKVVDVPNVTIIAPGQLRSDTTVRFGQSVSLKGSGALTYEWSPGYNITSLTKPNVTVNPFKTTQYILTGYNSKHCASSDTVNVIVIEDCGEMYVPNAFTPNNDGANDVLYVRGICLESLTFMVFNRWGEKVFETADQSVGWDGTYKGEDLNTAVFVYRLEGKTYDGKAFSSKGNITLIR